MEPVVEAHRGPLPCHTGGDVARAAPRGPGCAPDESGAPGVEKTPKPKP